MPDLINRPKFESRLADTLVIVFDKYLLEIQGLLSDFNTTLGDINTLPPTLFDDFQADLIVALEGILIEAFIEAFVSFDGHLSDNSTTTARRGALFVQEDAQQWASFYAPKLAADLANVTKTRLREIADRAPLLPISGLGLRDIIKPIFSFPRAQLVARTEITNVISVAEQRTIAGFEGVIEVELIWYTKLDERVCIICEPRHGMPQGTNWEVPPPAHPRCRCEVEYTVTYPDGRVIKVLSLEAVELGSNQIIEVSRG